MEIVNKLIELKLLDVVFTTDGKEYVTPQQLNREIQDELFVHGGNNNVPVHFCRANLLCLLVVI